MTGCTTQGDYDWVSYYKPLLDYLYYMHTFSPSFYDWCANSCSGTLSVEVIVLIAVAVAVAVAVAGLIGFLIYKKMKKTNQPSNLTGDQYMTQASIAALKTVLD